MTDAETRQMIEALSKTITDDLLDAPENKVAQHLVFFCDLFNYRLSEMDRHLFSIIAEARLRADRLPQRVF